ncbi:secreted RxLR effector protein 161-like [Vicia villosa]|uniref:secreted RxLR effector protein 161-like n=1 Tax=Vicia villosa TaxID=3911 RepID=UPI00273C1C2A|nr:secreted RxLR effector protein 161-like [Vicia villosa]
MEKPQECHLTLIKRVLRYIKGTIDHSVLMPMKKSTSTNAEVHGYTNSDFSGDQDEEKSIVGYIFMIRGALISWSSRKKSIVALSSCGAKYVAASYAACQTVWIEMLVEGIKVMKPKKIMLFVDDKSVV